MSDGGKGDSPRPYSVSQEQFASNWDLIFAKKKADEILRAGVTNSKSSDNMLLADDIQFEGSVRDSEQGG